MKERQEAQDWREVEKAAAHHEKLKKDGCPGWMLENSLKSLGMVRAFHRKTVNQILLAHRSRLSAVTGGANGGVGDG